MKREIFYVQIMRVFAAPADELNGLARKLLVAKSAEVGINVPPSKYAAKYAKDGVVFASYDREEALAVLELCSVQEGLSPNVWID